LVATLLYLVTPGVALSSFVVSTDAALLACLSLALWAYAVLQRSEGRARLVASAAFGASLGLGFLAKYAVLFAPAGVILHLIVSADARRAWSPLAAVCAGAAFAAIAAPNIVWNAAHGFATVAHTASNANWGAQLFNPMALGKFVLGQFGVFGPIPLAVFLGGAVMLARRRALQAPDALLLCFAVPPLLIVAAQALISRANDNWAAAAYPAATVLVAAWLLRWNARRWLAATFGLHALACLALIVLTIAPSLADRVGLANSLKRLRGWREMTAILVEKARLEGANGGVSAVAVDDRFFFNEAAYYGRDAFGRGGAPLTMWVKGPAPENQAELTAPLTPARGARVIAASLEGRNADAMAADFARATGREIASVSLDLRHHRSATLFVGEGFSPKPRR
jgi:4-amino-4-deoxy-L-arabinose transferase-like glycosyltransferase